MKAFRAGLAALFLVGCSSSNSTRTVEVNGAPGEIARFVTAEKGRDSSADVTYRTGESRAVFSVSTSEAQSEITDRATAARLAVVTKSTSWAFTSDP